MHDPSWLWAVFTLIAAAAQTVRNATQRELTRDLGTVGATHVRFLFGLPFALLFLIGILAATGSVMPRLPLAFLAWASSGALTQIAATALMLAAMGERSFVVAIAYTKTEPVQVALFGLIFLGDHLTAPMIVAILVATVGVMVMSVRGGQAGGLRPVLLGILSGGFFALSAIGFRGAIINLPGVHFVLAANLTLVVAMALQSVLLSVFLYIRAREVLVAIARAWRASLLAGFMGALASQFWFLGLALTTAANVRTLGLVEMVFAQAVSRFAFGQRTSPREALGIVLVVAGVALLITVQR